MGIAMVSKFGFSEAYAITLDERKELLEFASHLAGIAGGAILPFFRPDSRVSLQQIENKASDQVSGFDPVTEADRQAERRIRGAIDARYPSHGILGEEYGFAPGDGLTWVIDPIDGTRAFVMGLVHWGTLIALFDGQHPILGVIHQPFLGETFTGDGSTALYRRTGDEKIIITRACDSLADAQCATTSPELFITSNQRASFDHLRSQVRHLRYGTDCYAYAMLAMGQIDLVIETGLNPYDVQALIPIIEGAGGVITNWHGESAAMGGDVLACGDPCLHQTALKEIQSCLN